MVLTGDAVAAAAAVAADIAMDANGDAIARGAWVMAVVVCRGPVARSRTRCRTGMVWGHQCHLGLYVCGAALGRWGLALEGAAG